MPFTVYGQSGTALLWGPSGNRVDGTTIGEGSGEKTVDTSGLVTPALYKPFNDVDISTQKRIAFETDFSSVDISGLTVQEAQISVSGEDAWSIDGFPGVSFDGSQELRIRYVWDMY